MSVWGGNRGRQNCDGSRAHDADRLLIRPASGRQADTGLSARTHHWKDTRQRGHSQIESRTKSTGVTLTTAPDGTATHSQSANDAPPSGSDRVESSAKGWTDFPSTPSASHGRPHPRVSSSSLRPSGERSTTSSGSRAALSCHVRSGAGCRRGRSSHLMQVRAPPRTTGGRGTPRSRRRSSESGLQACGRATGVAEGARLRCSSSRSRADVGPH